MGDFSGRLSTQNSRGIHHCFRHACQRTKPATRLGGFRSARSRYFCRSSDDGAAAPPRGCRPAALWRSDDICCRLRPNAGSKPRSEEHTSELQSRQYLHSFPTRRSSDLEGFTIASVMLASGRSRRLAWGASVLLGAATFAGVLTMALLRRHVDVGLPLSGGVTIYVAASDLMPEVNRDRKSTRLNSSHANIYTLSLHDALPISRDSPLLPSCLPADEAGDSLGGLPFCSEPLLLPEF